MAKLIEKNRVIIEVEGEEIPKVATDGETLRC